MPDTDQGIHHPLRLPARSRDNVPINPGVGVPCHSVYCDEVSSCDWREWRALVTRARDKVVSSINNTEDGNNNIYMTGTL